MNRLLTWGAFVRALAIDSAVAGLVLMRQVVRIRELTLIDPLTGAMNRRALEGALRQCLLEQRRHGRPLAVVYLDLDHFKALNDRHGHAAADAALRHIVATVRGQVRVVDRIGRLGGAEFCVLLPYTGLDGARLNAERMRRAIENAPLTWQGAPIAISASFGVACAGPDDALEPADLLGRADRAMYAAKAQGRNRVVAAALPG